MSAVILLPTLRIIAFERIIGIIILWRGVCGPAVVLPLGLPEQLLLQVGEWTPCREESEEVGRTVREGGGTVVVRRHPFGCFSRSNFTMYCKGNSSDDILKLMAGKSIIGHLTTFHCLIAKQVRRISFECSVTG